MAVHLDAINDELTFVIYLHTVHCFNKAFCYLFCMDIQEFTFLKTAIAALIDRMRKGRGKKTTVGPMKQ